MATPEKLIWPPLVRNLNTPLSMGDVNWDLDRSDSDSDSDSDSESDRLGCRDVEMPEKHLVLCKFFSVIVSMISLLRMRRKLATFANIFPKIQSLTDRNFTIRHLAQLKYILPEVILVKRLRLLDEQTACMKEEFLITLDMEPVKAITNMKDIREIFRARLEHYYKTHIEENDIPEGDLFCQSNNASLVPLAQLGLLSESSTPSNVLATPINNSSAVAKDGCFRVEYSKETKGVIGIQGTPAKEALTPVRLMATGSPIMLFKDICDIPTKLSCHPNSRRSLKFDAPKYGAVTEVTENERKIPEEQDPAISQARRRHRLTSGVPELLNTINILFHSVNRSFMPKEEFLHKLISSHCEIVDRGEVEEQLKLLQELAPEYISERLCLSGDTLVCLNKSVSTESVLAKLQES